MREDAKPEHLEAWLQRLKQRHQAVWKGAPLIDSAAYVHVQNQKNLFKSLHLLLARRAAQAPLLAAAAAAERAILEGLGGL